MKYKVGDKVRVKSWDKLVEEFGVSPSGRLNIEYLYFSNNMKKYCGKVMEIDLVFDEFYYLKEDEGYLWSDDMLELFDADFDKKVNEAIETMLSHGNKGIKDPIYTFDDIPRIKNGSKIMIGKERHMEFLVDKHFNWLQKKMWKFLLGIKIEDYSED